MGTNLPKIQGFVQFQDVYSADKEVLFEVLVAEEV